MIGGFVQQNDLWLLGESTSQKYTLKLSSGQSGDQMFSKVQSACKPQAFFYYLTISRTFS